MNNTLRNGLVLLAHLASTTSPFTLTALVAQLGLPKSHVHRLLQTLCEDGWVVQDPDRRYRIGLKPLELSRALLTHLPLRQASLPVLRELVVATGYDAVFTHMAGDFALVIAGDYAMGRQQDPATAVGIRLSLHASACGKMLAALQPAEVQQALLARLSFPAHSPRTLTTAAAVQEEWTRIRFANHSVNRGENGPSVGSIGVPVRDERQYVLGSLGMSMPLADLAANEVRVIAMLHVAADRIARSRKER